MHSNVVQQNMLCLELDIEIWDQEKIFCLFFNDLITSENLEYK